MQISPFLEIFIGFFLALGAGFGWFSRWPVIIFALAVSVLVFAVYAYLSSQNPPANPELSREDLRIAALLAALAAVPAFLSAWIARSIKRRRET